MTLGLSMIVKNESEVLDRVPSWERGAVDVDTGSIDGTADIARRHIDKVYSFVWIDDFAVARNELL